MKFPKPDIPKEKTLHIPALSLGMTDFENTHTDEIYLSEGKNIFFEKGLLKTRPGLQSGEDNIIDSGNFAGGYDHTFKLSETEITFEGIRRKILTETVNFDDSLYVCTTHIISPDGWVRKCASMKFHRLSDESFFIPTNINYVKGASDKGIGLYAIVKLVNTENFSEKEGRIFELSEDLSEWISVISTYIPTAYINGRGNKYEFSAASNQAFTGIPTRLEKLNLLNGYFHAYYSSDGYSSVFRLPFSDIADDTVYGRFYYSLDNYTEWIIEPGKTSAQATYNKNPVTMHINRQTGIVYFTVEAGDFEVPLITHQNENNLKITARKECDFNLTDIAGSTANICVNSKILLANGNKIFAAHSSNPLYFPADNVTVLGEEDTTVTAFMPYKNTVFAFKENEIYRISLKERKALNSVSLLSDNDSIFYTGNIISSQRISKSSGCAEQGHLICNSDKLCWLGNDKIYYGMNFSDSSPHPLCKDTFDADEETKISAFAISGYNIFMRDNHGLIFKADALTFPAYFWEFPENYRVLCACQFEGKPLLIVENTTFRIYFTAFLQGDCDILADLEDQEYTLKEFPIENKIKTVKIPLGCDNTLKKIKNVAFKLRGKNAVIRVNESRWETGGYSYDGALNSYKITPTLPAINTIQLEISAKNPIAVGSIDIGYYLMEL